MNIADAEAIGKLAAAYKDADAFLEGYAAQAAGQDMDIRVLGMPGIPTVETSLPYDTGMNVVQAEKERLSDELQALGVEV
jgi:hypothetical protein